MLFTMPILQVRDSSLFKYCHCVKRPQQAVEENVVKLAKLHHRLEKMCVFCREEDVQWCHLSVQRAILSTYLFCITRASPRPSLFILYCLF